MIVVDASILATGLADDGLDGDRLRARLRGEQLVAPHLVDLDALRRERAAHRPLMIRCWELRHNLTLYDAACVALAEMAGVDLLTADTRLATAPGVRCGVEVM